MKRIDKDMYFMNIAVQVSLRSTCMRRRVGSIIVKDNNILSTGYNGAPSGLPNCIDDCKRCYRSANNIPSGAELDKCFAVHSEQNAIMNALKSGDDLTGASIYVTTFPCSTCAKLCIQAGIKHIYYIDSYEDVFTKKMLQEANIETHVIDGSIFQVPSGTSVTTSNDLDAIDPLVKEIYKYQPGTKEFEENRDKVFKKNNLYDRYNELIFYTEYKFDNELMEFDCDLLNDMDFKIGNRNELEYNGDNYKQLVVGAIVYDPSMNSTYLLKCKGERLKNKYTMVQGHVSAEVEIPEHPTRKEHNIMDYIVENLYKELKEEINLDPEDVEWFKPLYIIQTNDNKLSSEHVGIIFGVGIDERYMQSELTSGEPDKHTVVKVDDVMLFEDEDFRTRLDTWLFKCVGTPECKEL